MRIRLSTIFPAPRTILVLIWCLCVALNGLRGTAQAQNPVPLINLPLVPDAIAPGQKRIYADGEWHRLCRRLSREVERQPAGDHPG